MRDREPNTRVKLKIKVSDKYPIRAWGLPKYATPGSACFDIKALAPVDTEVLGDIWGVDFTESKAFHTGLYCEVPEGHVMLIYSRSGHAAKHQVRLENCTGVIDSDYRGELLIRLRNDSDRPMRVVYGDRIAQAMIIKLPDIELELADELSETLRGEGGFGSTGSK